MEHPLTTYVHDHLGGAAAAVQLLEALREHHAGEALGDFASELMRELETDRRLLLELAAGLDGEPSSLKDAAGWLSAHFSQLKIHRKVAGELGSLEVLEAVALGILGKLALWRALEVIAPGDPRLERLPFAELAAGAQAQHGRVEMQRLRLAASVLRPGTVTDPGRAGSACLGA